MWPTVLRTSLMVLKMATWLMGTKKTLGATILTTGTIEIMTHYQDQAIKST